MGIDHVGLMSYGTWHTFTPVVFLDPLFPFVRIRGFQRLRIQRTYSSNSLCLFHPFLFFLFVFDVLYTVINSVEVHTLPTEQVTSAPTDSFFAGS